MLIHKPFKTIFVYKYIFNKYLTLWYIYIIYYILLDISTRYIVYL